MTTAVEIPFQAMPQRMTVTLGGTDYVLQTRWNRPEACWTMDISDAGGNLLIGQLPLVTGVDLLSQFRYLGIAGSGAQLVVFSDHDFDAVPLFAELGVNGHVALLTP